MNVAKMMPKLIEIAVGTTTCACELVSKRIGMRPAAVVKEGLVSVLRNTEFRREEHGNAYTVTGRKVDAEVYNRSIWYPVFFYR